MLSDKALRTLSLCSISSLPVHKRSLVRVQGLVPEVTPGTDQYVGAIASAAQKPELVQTPATLNFVDCGKAAAACPQSSAGPGSAGTRSNLRGPPGALWPVSVGLDKRVHDVSHGGEARSVNSSCFGHSCKLTHAI